MLKPRQFRVGQLAFMNMHRIEFRTSGKRRHGFAGIKQAVRIKNRFQ